MKPITHTFDIGDGRTITIETGKLAKQADGSAVVRMGNTMLLATICAEQEAGENVDFLPLTVEYKEKYAAAGRFPGGFFKREARPSDYEILICRLIDRALRPLFPDDFHANTVVTVNLISLDPEIYPDQLACLAASAALIVSDIPFNGPISEVRIGRIGGKLVINPKASDMATSDLDMIIAASEQNLVMVEGEMKEISEHEMVEAIKFGHDAIKLQIKALNELASKVEKSKTKRTYNHEKHDEDLKKAINDFCFEKCKAIAKQGLADKHKRSELFKNVKAEFVATLAPEVVKEKEFLIDHYYHATEKEAMRRVVLDEKVRLDGRKTDQIRPIWSEVDYLPSAHGSAIFTRGETQSLTTVTLGGKLDEQDIDGVVFSGSNRFLLHYNFPAFSTGEARASRGTSRREVGHGNLAYRALKNIIPEDCPYTVRVVSDILESNGSSSMATVCAGSLSLFDSGIQMKGAVAGIAMGLITDDSGKYAVLSDILGDEDHLGDMDFKVAGTAKGITATQMDLKVNGLPYEVLESAVEQARLGRLHILGEMEKTLTKPNENYKDHAPRLIMFEFSAEFMGAVIGTGGKVIQEIQKTTGTEISLEEAGKMCKAQIAGPNGESVKEAMSRIQAIIAQPEVGEVYEATVVSIQPYGAFVEFMPGKEGLLHISEISHKRLETLDGVVKQGDKVKVKLLDIDKKSGKYKLSRKVLLPKPEANEN